LITVLLSVIEHEKTRDCCGGLLQELDLFTVTESGRGRRIIGEAISTAYAAGIALDWRCLRGGCASGEVPTQGPFAFEELALALRELTFAICFDVAGGLCGGFVACGFKVVLNAFEAPLELDDTFAEILAHAGKAAAEYKQTENSEDEKFAGTKPE
jgi:hypothetical protein